MSLQDSCQGDSGGPYYVHEKDNQGRDRVVIIAMVSRGNGCAERNEPGKATRIRKFLKWIKEVVKREGGKNNSSSGDSTTTGEV